jgi:hypothetical protein
VGAHAQENCCAHGPELDPTPPQIANALYTQYNIRSNKSFSARISAQIQRYVYDCQVIFTFVE